MDRASTALAVGDQPDVQVTEPIPDRSTAFERDDDLTIGVVNCHEAGAIRQANTVGISSST